MQITRIGVAALGAVTVLGIGTARADEGRSGYLGGLGLGVGELSAECAGGCEGALESVSGSAHFGRMMSPKLALVADAWALAYSEENATLYHTILTLGAQYWVTPKLWLRGGLGAAVLSLDYDDETVAESDTVPAIMIGAGYELMQRDSFALDLQVRSGAGFYEEADVYSASVSLGATWYFGGSNKKAEQKLAVAEPPPRPRAKPRPRKVERRVAEPPAPPTREVVATIQFAHKKSRLDRHARAALDPIVERLVDERSARVEVVGHTDATGGDDLNTELSMARADAVRDYLIAGGVDEDRIITDGRSADAPLADNETRDGRARNRRAEVILVRAVARGATAGKTP